MSAAVVEACTVIDLLDPDGRKRLARLKHKVFTLCEFEGD